VVKPPKPSPGYTIDKTKLLMNAIFENLGPDNSSPSNLDLVLQSGTSSYLNHDSQDEKMPEVPGLQKTQGIIAFYIDDKFTLSNALLLAGNARYNQTQLAAGELGQEREPGAAESSDQRDHQPAGSIHDGGLGRPTLL